MKNKMENTIQERIEELLMKVQTSEPTSVVGSNHIHNVFEILTEDEWSELSTLCEIQEMVGYDYSKNITI